MLTDADALRNRMSDLQQRREEAMRLSAMTRRQLDAPRNIITPKKIDAFTTAMRDRLSNGPVEFRKAYVRLFVERIEVDDNEVRISGSKAALSKALAEQAATPRHGAHFCTRLAYQRRLPSNPLSCDFRWLRRFRNKNKT